MYISDIHTHTIASGHAYGTIREMVRAASDKELAVLGITEHGPGIPGTVDTFYYNNLRVIPKEIYGVRLIHGCEINILNDGTLFLEEQYIEKLDYAIAGIHVQCYEDAGKRKNTDNVISCMQHPKVRLITHPDDDHTPLDYKRLVKAAKLTNTALEVNNSSLVKKDMRLGCYDNYRRMLKLCMEYEAPIIVNSDAHDPSWVGEFSLAEELLKEISFPDSLILNNEQDKLFRFLLSWMAHNITVTEDGLCFPGHCEACCACLHNSPRHAVHLPKETVTMQFRNGRVTIAINATQRRKTLAAMLQSKAFVLGIPSIDQVREADYLGVESGYNTDKIKNIGYTTTEAKTVHAPVINELPLALECEIVHTVTIGSHMQVTGEVKRILAEESILNEKGRIDLARLKPIIYDEEQVQYLSVGEKISDAFRVGVELTKTL